MRTSIFAFSVALIGCGSSETSNSSGAPDAQPVTAEAMRRQDNGVATTELGAVSIDVARLANARPGDAFDLDLGAAGSIATRTIAVERLGEGRFSWSARTIAQGAPDGEATLIVDGAAITGSVRTPEGVLYRINPTENGNTIERVDTGQMPLD
jgi:hypothetical protein